MRAWSADAGKYDVMARSRAASVSGINTQTRATIPSRRKGWCHLASKLLCCGEESSAERCQIGGKAQRPDRASSDYPLETVSEQGYRVAHPVTARRATQPRSIFSRSGCISSNFYDTYYRASTDAAIRRRRKPRSLGRSAESISRLGCEATLQKQAPKHIRRRQRSRAVGRQTLFLCWRIFDNSGLEDYHTSRTISTLLHCSKLQRDCRSKSLKYAASAT